ncbi:MAG: carbohydrate-binding protein [Lewinellaceae bacterium]|nr:carbohydrate-binding protein [Lewinellaceae bacterium]
MKNSKYIVLVFITALAIQVNAQHFLSTNGKAIVNENQDTILLRGMGLGGWMVQEGYMLQTAGFANPQHEIRAKIEELIGEADTDLFYDAWLANHVRKADIDSLKAWGFNSVRLPMHYNLFTLPIEEEPVAGQNTWLTKGFELTDSLISWCKQNEMYVVLDLHAAPGGQGYDAGISDYDPTKPSLWESQENRDKMVALWKNLAERYAEEQWVAGYDLLNEPNWNLPGNIALRDLYWEITDSIRTVDTRHILFIEGNWFANDFTGLTPPWDDNMVYSPHKYWSLNDEATMQWVLDIRNTYNVPLYLGESGENSNVWFRDAIRLLEGLNIGWAWWPMKKIESIAGPLSVIKTPEYQSLLDYWNGNGTTPTAEFARTTLMEITEGLKAENCVFQKDVIDAMFRQVYSDETIPFNTHNIPGVVYATDFDMGVIGKAYFDKEAANYQVSTGNYTPWNNGWVYRNDGVDIEPCEDDVNTNGYSVGWLETDEWMQYEVNVAASGVYEIHVRAASGGSGGRLHFAAGGADITPPSFAPPTGGWQNWQTLVIPDVILDTSDKKLRLYTDAAGFNISSFELVETGATSASIPTAFVAAITVDEYTVQMNANKFLDTPLPTAPGGFEILVDGTSIPITAMMIDADNTRIIYFTVDYILKSTETIRISYSGNQVNALDGTALDHFTLEEVKNTLMYVHPVPGRIEAEDYVFQSGVELETTTDIGGGQNIGYLDPGDYLDYEINVGSTGAYRVDYRTASLDATGALELQLIDEEGNATLLHAPSFAPTGDWQNWATTSENVQLTEGRHKMRVAITQSPFNMNWFEFSLLANSTKDPGQVEQASVFPNPNTGLFSLEASLKERQDIDIEIYNLLGQPIWKESLKGLTDLRRTIDLRSFSNGSYFLSIRMANGKVFTKRIVKMD